MDNLKGEVIGEKIHKHTLGNDIFSADLHSEDFRGEMLIAIDKDDRHTFCLFKKLGEEFGVFRQYNNPDTKVTFSFSKGGMSESVSKQHKGYMCLAKLLTCIDSVIENTVGIETHNRNDKGYKVDTSLKNVYVLASAFVDGENIIPVKLEVKEFSDKENTLYVAIALESIKKNEIVKQEVATNGVARQYSPSFNISIADFLRKIKPSDESFYKYIPKKLLETSKDGNGQVLNVKSNDSPQPTSKTLLDGITATDSISYSENVNTLSKKFSERSALPEKNSQGEALSEQQRAYFANSKVVDEQGRLLTVYHGSPNKFTEFQHRFMNTHGNAHGRGFYFTEDMNYAEGYRKDGGQLLKGYLDIKKPASETKTTMRKAELVKLIKATCDAQAKELIAEESYGNMHDALLDTWVSNYVNTYDAYSMDSVYKQVAEIIFNNSDNDVDILAELTNAGAGTERVLSLARKVLGYDGIIYDNGNGTHQFIAFESSQFKNADNTNPTNNSDIRYSPRQVDSNGNEYWQIETEKDIFSRVSNVAKLKKLAFNYILNGYKGTDIVADVDGKNIKFVRISANEFVYGIQSQQLNKEAYKQKMRMSTSILDLVDNATISYNAPDHKNHKLFPNGFQNYQGRVGIDSTIFRYIVRVGKAKNDAIFYDINLEVDGKVPRANRTSLIKFTSTSDNSLSYSSANVNREISKNIDVFEKDSKSSERESISNRMLLANALESVAQNDIEKSKLISFLILYSRAYYS